MADSEKRVGIERRNGEWVTGRGRRLGPIDALSCDHGTALITPDWLPFAPCSFDPKLGSWQRWPYRPSESLCPHRESTSAGSDEWPFRAASAIESVAFSPCGSMLALRGRRGDLSLWDINRGDLIREFPAPAHLLKAHVPAFAPDALSITFGQQQSQTQPPSSFRSIHASSLISLNDFSVQQVSQLEQAVPIGFAQNGDLLCMDWPAGYSVVDESFPTAITVFDRHTIRSHSRIEFRAHSGCPLRSPPVQVARNGRYISVDRLILDLTANRIHYDTGLIDLPPVVFSADSELMLYGHMKSGAVLAVDSREEVMRYNRDGVFESSPLAMNFFPDGERFVVVSGRDIAVRDTYSGLLDWHHQLEFRPDLVALSPDAARLFVAKGTNGRMVNIDGYALR